MSKPGVTRSHFTGGRGSSKTTTGVLKALRATTEWCPGLPGIWTEPTSQLCRDVFIKEWQKIVPSGLYKLNLSTSVIRMINGSTIDIRTRNADNPSKEVSKGPNYAWAIDDEMAYKYSIDKYWDIDNAIRLPTPYLFHDTLSTPKMNEYYDLCHTEGHNLISATSWDNPFLPDGYADERAAQMSTKRREQELMGMWVALSGLIWDNWSNDEWPKGNVYHTRHTRGDPYYLFFDIGVASSAWVIVQRKETSIGSVWVATAEYTPDRDGSVARICKRIMEDYGRPARIVAGADLSTRSQTDARTPQYFVTQVFGSVPVVPVKGWIADKEIQYDRLAYLINSTDDKRRFCVASNFKSHDQESKRGVKEMMQQDCWAEKNTNRRADFLPKEGRLEHVRDALLYGAVACMAPPRYVHANSYAK